MLPASTEVLAIAREELRSTLASLRLKRETERSWTGPIGSGWLRFRIQLWDRGSLDDQWFTGELELDGEDGGAFGRILSLLTDEEREEHRQIQNLVIAKSPLDETELDTLPPEWQAERLTGVTPRLAPYPPDPPDEDVWFRYVDADDVRRWMRFIGRVLPDAVDRLERMRPNVIEAALAADHSRAIEVGDPFEPDEGDVRAADEAMRRLNRLPPSL